MAATDQRAGCLLEHDPPHGKTSLDGSEKPNIVPDIILSMEMELDDYCSAKGDACDATPPMPIAAVSAPPDPALRLPCGGRAALERELLWAAVLDRPTFVPLLRQLTPAANDAFFGLASSGEPRDPPRSDA